MNRSLLSVMGVLALCWPVAAQDRAKPVCELVNVVEEDNQYVCSYKSQFSKGANLNVFVERTTTALVWAAWFEKNPAGAAIERINSTIERTTLSVRGTKGVKVGKDGAFEYVFKPPHPGVFTIKVEYDPPSQPKVDPRFKEPVSTSHTVIAFKEDHAQKIVVDEAAEALAFIEEFFGTLRSAMGRARSHKELNDEMATYLEKAAAMVEGTYHPGIYSLFTNLEAYAITKPRKEGDPLDLVTFSTERIDLKAPSVPFSCVRESMVVALNLAEACVQAAQRLALLSEEATDDRPRLVKSCVKELASVVGGLQKLDKSGTAARLMTRTKLKKVLTDAGELVVHLVDSRKPSENAVKEIVDRITEAAGIIGDPHKSLE